MHVLMGARKWIFVKRWENISVQYTLSIIDSSPFFNWEFLRCRRWRVIGINRDWINSKHCNLSTGQVLTTPLLIREKSRFIVLNSVFLLILVHSISLMIAQHMFQIVSAIVGFVRKLIHDFVPSCKKNLLLDMEVSAHINDFQYSSTLLCNSVVV